MSQQETIVNILFKRFTEELSGKEQSMLNNWLAESANNRYFFERINSEEDLRNLILSYKEQKREGSQARVLDKLKAQLFALDQQDIVVSSVNTATVNHAKGELNGDKEHYPLTAIVTETNTSPTYYQLFLKWGWVAAAAILLVAIGTRLLSTKPEFPPSITQLATDIAPGQQGAILTLADGSQLLLDSMNNGLVALQKGAQVLLHNGQLAYDPTGELIREQSYNSITTPKGRQYNLQLPDGTKVWLNAASSIRYPTVFSGEERKVQLTGEAYFEIAKNTKMPFRVETNNNAEVEVLGTYFNINAYENEASIKTTLLEGSVKVQDNTSIKNAVILKPGQQAQILANNINTEKRNPQSKQHKILVTQADLDKVMAWKNGAFNFEGIGLQDAMRQIERWYDIEVVYSNGIPDIKFGGKISRGVSLNGLLKILAGAKLHVRIEDRKLIILP